MSIFDDIRNDVKGGTPGPWEWSEEYPDDLRPLWICDMCQGQGYLLWDDTEKEDIDARRIARVPDLERIALAAEKLEKAAELVTSDCAPTAWDWKRYSAARDAFRAAVEEAQ